MRYSLIFLHALSLVYWKGSICKQQVIKSVLVINFLLMHSLYLHPCSLYSFEALILTYNPGLILTTQNVQPPRAYLACQTVTEWDAKPRTCTLTAQKQCQLNAKCKCKCVCDWNRATIRDKGAHTNLRPMGNGKGMLAAENAKKIYAFSCGFISWQCCLT